MSLKTTTVRYGGEPESGYLAYPERAKTPLPAVLVLQEAWGVDAHIEDVTRRFAAAGYVALAPDLYAKRGERPAELTRERLAELQAFVNSQPVSIFMDPKAREAALATLAEDESTRIQATMGTMMVEVTNLPAHLPRLLAATQWLREECDLTRGEKVAVVGFCMGGGLSGLLACHDPGLAAAIAFYGSPPPPELATRLTCPLLGLYGGLDDRINGQLPAFEAAAKGAGKRFERVVYEGAHHAFFNDSRPTYDPSAARDAFVRTLGLLKATLAP